jgi:hypothetical protein
MQFQIFAFLALIAILLVSCSGAPTASEADRGFEGAAPEEPAAEPAFDESGSVIVDTSNVQPGRRIVIMNARLTLVVDDPGDAMDQVVAIAEGMGGFVVNANLGQTILDSGTEAQRAVVSVRVPAERLNEALDQIQALSNQEPQVRAIESQDVTQEYTDLQSRLRNLQNTEAQLNQILEEANTTEDVLAVYNELAAVREQIEVIQGKIQYYDQVSAMSLIEVTLLPNEAVQPLRIGRWEPAGVARDAVQALLNSLQFIGTAIIWLVVAFLPVILILALVFGVPLWLLVRLLRRPRKSRQPAPPPSPSNPA